MPAHAHCPIITFSMSHQLMDSGLLFALDPPAHVDQACLGSPPSTHGEMPQRKKNPRIVENHGQAAPHEGTPSFLKTIPMVSPRPPRSPKAISRIKSLGDLGRRTNHNYRLNAESTESFSTLHTSSGSSDSFQTTSSTVLFQRILDDSGSHADLSADALQSHLQEQVSPSKQLFDFCRSLFHQDSYYAYLSFLRAYPEYKLTRPVDTLRKSEYKRLKRADEVYLDYTGAALYPEGLVRSNSEFLRQTILGNTHSSSNSSHQSAMCAEEARSRVLAFFDAPVTEYTVVFTHNATGALKLVGEAFPFGRDSTFVLGTDSHNSVNGIRQFALAKGALLAYISSTLVGGVDEAEAKSVLLAHGPRSRGTGAPSLFALTGLSNVTNSKNPLSLLAYASNLGYSTLLDAAALATTSKISLRHTPADAMAVSFYKMFGFPTGIGCLVVKKSFLRQLKRPWFSGGTVEVVQVPGIGFTSAQQICEQFEDGTINFASLAAVTKGLNMLSQYLPYLPLRLSTLTRYLAESLAEIKHDVTGTPIARILSRTPDQRLTAIGEQSDTGSMVSLVFLEPSGEIMSNSFIEYAATKHRISLRTGCMCNPGGVAAILGIQAEMERFYPGITFEDFENIVGRELGVVRLSLGLASDFSDMHHLLSFVREVIACDAARKKVSLEWKSRWQRHA